MVREVRKCHSRNDKTSFCVIDSQRVKNTDSAQEKGYDGAKKITGIKRPIAVDSQGLPHAIYITKVDVRKRKAAIEMINQHQENLSQVKHILVDGGYRGEKFEQEVKKTLQAHVQVAKRNERHKFVLLPKRWIVERSFAWLNKCRPLWKNTLIPLYIWLY